MTGLPERLLAEHGPTARIVAAERVRIGGIGGFFARQHYEVTVEVDDAGAAAVRRRRGAHAMPDATARLGIAALLDEADERETRIHSLVPDEAVSTDSEAFAAIMDDLTFNTVTPDPPVVPRPLDGAGDLVVVVGLGLDAFAVAGAMAEASQTGIVATAGAAQGGGPSGPVVLNDRREVLAARAAGVARGGVVFLAFGLDASARPPVREMDLLATFGPDQVWVAVDAGRKPADTARWVGAVTNAVVVDAVAAVGMATTSTPGTVGDLGLPIGWDDAGSHA